MGKKLFVGGLAYSVTTDELNELFAKIGEVASAQVITDKFSNQSKGFGFVEMVNDADADKAIEQLNETSYAGRTIAVNEARPKEQRSYGSSNGGGSSNYGGGSRGGNDRRTSGGSSNGGSWGRKY